MRCSRLAPVLLLAPLLLSACGDDGTSPDQSSSASATPATSSSEGDAAAAPEEPSAELLSVEDDVTTLAPALESFYRGGDYPTSLDEVLGTLDEAGVGPSEGNTVAAYTYDPDQVEFVLCVEGPSGAWATYDTAPMTVQESAESGGCPQ